MYRAARDWARATGMADPDNLKAANAAFVESASSGRKWRGSPTTLVAHLRAIGTGAATCWLRLASAVAPLLVGYIVGAGGIRAVFLMFAAVGVAGALAGALMLETRNRRLEDIAG